MSILSSSLDDDSLTAHMNWRETPNAHVFEFELPGVFKDDIKVELHQGSVLRIMAQRRDDDDDESDSAKWHCKERLRGTSFTRQFRLPIDAKADEIKASFSDGVLILNVPKDLQITNKIKSGKIHHPQRRRVHISGGDDEEEESHIGHKGIAKFVCCKA